MSATHHAQLRLGPLEGVHAVLMHSDRSFGRHWHDSYGFGVMDAGGHRSVSGRGAVEALAGHIVTTNPGEVHDGMPLDRAPRRWRMIHLTPGAMARLTGQVGQELTRPVLDDPRLRAVVLQVFHHWDRFPTGADPATHTLWEESLTQACGWLVDRHGLRPPERAASARLDAVCECLLDQMDAPPRLDDLVRLSGLSRFQLIRQFASAHGLPPFAWLQQHRLRRARQLIAGGAALAEAAAATGFADQSHLSRHFVRSFGFTPGQWRRACHGTLQ